MEKIKFAFLGVAHIHSNNYARAIKELPEAELKAVYEQNEKVGREFSKKFEIDYYNDCEKLLKTEDIDAVVITSETAKHYDLAMKAIEAGKHILCEKPIAMTLKEADEMIKSAEKAGLKFQTCFVMRYHTTSWFIKNLIDDGRIGKVLAIIGTNKLNVSLPLSMDWFLNPELSGGGAIMDHTVLLADLIRWYTDSEALEVYTETGRNMVKNIGVEDNFLTTLTMENGVIGHIDGSWSYASGFYTWGDVTLEVLGSEGVILLDAFRQNVYYVGMEAPNDKLIWHYYGCDADKEMIKSFVNCILRDEAPRASGFDGRQGLAITLASYESLRLGRPVRPG